MQNLSIDQLNQLLDQKIEKPILIKYWAGYCSHCKKFAPIYDQLANQLENITVTQVECVENKDFCDQKQIEGFPTVRLYTSDGIYEYDGDRSLQDLINWIEKMKLPTFQTADLQNQNQIQQILQNYNQTTYFTVKSNDFVKMEKIFNKFKGKIVVFSIFDENQNKIDITAYRSQNLIEKYQGNPSDQKELAEFIIKTSFPPIINLDSQIFSTLLSIQRKMFIISCKNEQKQNIQQTLQKFAESINYSEFQFGFIDTEIFSDFLVSLSIQPENDSLIIFDEDDIVFSQYIKNESISQQIEGFIQNYKNKLLSPQDILIMDKEQQHQDFTQNQNNNIILYTNVAIAGVFFLILILSISYAIKCMKAPKQCKNEVETQKIEQISNKEDNKDNKAEEHKKQD